MLSHKCTEIIETERLMLRRFTIDDVDSMFNNWASDNEVCKYMRWLPHKNREETQRCISNWLDFYNKESFYRWAITLKKDDKPIGSIGLFVVNENDLCGDIAYCIGKKNWGQGIVTEALRAILRFAFETIGFNRIEAYHSTNNPASGRVMEKSGMVFEGFAKQKYKSISGFEDCNMYALVKEGFNMELSIKQMNYDEAKQISKWIYKEPYSIYSMDGSDNCIDELLNGTYFSVSDRENNLIGYYCFGESAQVPVGNQFDVYDCKDITDIGLGINPNLCGQGLGLKFFSSGLDFARNKLSAKGFRLTVAAFNQRAIKVYQRAGFEKVNSFEKISETGKIDFWIMVLC